MTAPQITYLIESNQWRLEESFEIKGVLIHAGFRCDLASIPRPLWGLIAPFELSVEAPLLHDYLYRHTGMGIFSRYEVDRLFLQVMHEEGVPAWRSRLAYLAVRLFGGFAWKGRD